MKSRSRLIWVYLIICALVVVAAMTAVTARVRASQRERSLAEARAQLEEMTRLALWRLDAAGSAILLRENQRFPSPEGGGNPVADEASVRMRFECRGDQVIARGAPRETIAQIHGLLAKNGGAKCLLQRAAVAGGDELAAATPRPPQAAFSAQSQELYNINEMAQRAKAVQSQVMANAIVPAQEPLVPSGPASNMRALWVDGELLLLRSIGDASRADSSIQGVWLDANALRKQLLATVADLLPEASLTELRRPAAEAQGLALVSLPFELRRNEALSVPSPPWDAALTVAWIAVGGAWLAIAVMVHCLMRLSERRASFVSAVTHELRTPLTSFQLYADLLGNPAVPDAKRHDYLRALNDEADRLSRLVQNVLIFSRVERGPQPGRRCALTIPDWLDPVRPGLEARLATAGMALRIELDEAPTPLLGDPAAIEHILFNLIDNAAKYAASGDQAEVMLQVMSRGKHVEIHVVDHGPGIPLADRRRIFRPFHKSAQDAANSRPGVGLGLALAQRLARSQNGQLELAAASAGEGAHWILRLRAAPNPPD